jgi:hypothetical protein
MPLGAQFAIEIEQRAGFLLRRYGAKQKSEATKEDGVTPATS